MLKTTLIYVFNPAGQILLCAKKKSNSGFTVSLGKWNGAGGKLDWNETFLQGAQRELEEETGIIVDESRFEHVGVIHFSFATKKEWDQECHVYVIKNYTGEFQETDELFPQWWNVEDIPYEKMWADDIYWMPRMLKGEKIEYVFHFSDEGEILHHEIIK